MFGILARACVFALSLALAATLAACGPAADSGTPESELPRIGVDDLMLDPHAYTGEIAVEGIVVDVSPEHHGVTLVDPEEYEMCGLNPCAAAGVLPLFLPTSGKEPSFSGDFYDGTLPGLEDRVLVIGAVRSGEMGLYFDAERVVRGSSAIIEKR